MQSDFTSLSPPSSCEGSNQEHSSVNKCTSGLTFCFLFVRRKRIFQTFRKVSVRKKRSEWNSECQDIKQACNPSRCGTASLRDNPLLFLKAGILLSQNYEKEQRRLLLPSDRFSYSNLHKLLPCIFIACLTVIFIILILFIKHFWTFLKSITHIKITISICLLIAVTSTT